MIRKYKIAKCIDCPESDPAKEVMAKRCIKWPHYHYQNHKRNKYYSNKVNSNNSRISQTIESNDGLSLSQWFKDRIREMPRYCQNCSSVLSPYAVGAPHSFIAHIVPKNRFSSMAVHPLNCVFLCVDCHHKYDSCLSSEVVHMPCWPIVLKRFNDFKYDILPSEVHSLRTCFYDHWFD